MHRRRAVGDDEAALALLERAASAGLPLATMNVGVMHEEGRGTAVDYAKAARMFKVAADADWPEAKYKLSLCLETGRGIEKDTERAMELLKGAADGGAVAACVSLARKLEHGDSDNGIAQNSDGRGTLLPKGSTAGWQ